MSDIFPPVVRRLIHILYFKRFGIAVLVKIPFYQFLYNRGILHIGKEHVNQAGLPDGEQDTGCLRNTSIRLVCLMENRTRAACMAFSWSASS